jgi:hypothetical protein
MKGKTGLKRKPSHALEQEPIGIVISRGSRSEQAPMVSEYVWGPAPEISEDAREPMVA